MLNNEIKKIAIATGFEAWAISEGRSVKPASEYSPQVYASTPSNNALAGWLGRQPAFDALKSDRDELVSALVFLRNTGSPALTQDYDAWKAQMDGVDALLAKYPETPTS